MKKLRIFLLNGLTLTATSLLLRTVGVFFNSFITAKLGPAGTGLFTLVMSVYTLAVTFATSGINLAATRMTAETLGNDDKNGLLPAKVRAVMKKCIGYALLIGSAAGILLFSASGMIGEKWLGDTDTVLSLRVLAFSLPFIAFSSALGGYFNAVRRAAKGAASQLFEQVCKIFLTVFLLSRLLPLGTKYACAAVVAGSCVAEGLSCVSSGIMFLADLRRHYPKTRGTAPETDGKTLRAKLLGITVPVSLTAYVRSGLLTLEHILIPRGLRKNGAGYEDSLASYGTVSGMALPVVLYPSAVMGSFAGLLIPEIAETNERGKHRRITQITENVIRLSLLFAVGCSAVISDSAGLLGAILYPDTSAAMYISLLAPLIPVMYLDMAVDAILKGLGEQVYSMKVNIIDAAVSVALVWLLIPFCGVTGYIITVFISEILNALMSVARLRRLTGFSFRFFRWFVFPMLSGAASLLISRLFYPVYAFLSPVAALLIRLVFASLIYIFFLTLFGCIRKNRLILPQIKKS